MSQRDKRLASSVLVGLAMLMVATAGRADDKSAAPGAAVARSRPATDSIAINRPAGETESPAPSLLPLPGAERDLWKNVSTFALFGLISLAPMGLLMVTAFVRINIVLILLRQALGSPQVPGNQILTALSLLLTALVMWPIGEKVYHDAVVPYQSKKLELAGAWDAGSRPIKSFMIDQIKKTNHEEYLHVLHDYAVPASPGQLSPGSLGTENISLRVVAPAFLLSELTTALTIGFFVYLPFLVIDLVVSAVLAATGLFMLPPALVATPIKLIVFVLADGWMLIATTLLATFAVGAGGP